MTIRRITRVFRLLEWYLLAVASAVYGLALAVAQPQLAELELVPPTVSEGLQSPDQAREDQDLQTKPKTTDAVCGVHEVSHDTWREVSHFGQGLKAVPGGVVRPSNLKWELPILAATGILIAKVDKLADNRIPSLSFQ